MKVVICGAGQVGFHIARYLAADDNDITVVDQSAELIQSIQDTLDVRGLVGFASHPNILDEANVGEADMLIAVTAADEVNMVACQVAHSLFDVPKKIARIRSPRYQDPIWSDLFGHQNLPIDSVISPEREVARAIERRLRMPGAFDMIPLADDRIRLIGVHCHDDCPVINTPLRQLTALFPDLNIVIVAIQRGDRRIVPTANEQMLVGDDVYFVAESRHVPRVMSVFGHAETEARRVIMMGGGNIGLALAEAMDQQPHLSVRLIESDRNRARFAAQGLNKVMVIHGDALDPTILKEAGVADAEAVIAVTNNDNINILASLLAKHHGARRAITLVNKEIYDSLIKSLGIDVVVSPRAITVSTILQHVRRGRIRQVHSVGEEMGEIIVADALETSSIVGPPLREINLPQEVIIAAIVRDDTVIMPRADTRVHANDRVAIFAAPRMVKTVERILRVSPEYF